MKVVFFGTPYFVNPVREALKKNFDVVDYSNQTIKQLNNLSPDLFVVAAYGKLLPSELLNIPKYGALNIHPSLLPKYRGPTPVQTAILNGDTETGVSIIVLDSELDHGPILVQKSEPIYPTDTTQSLHERLFKIGAEMLDQNIQKYIKKQIKPSPQDHSKATFTKKLTREDGFFDSNNPPPPEQLDRMIRAYFPWPGVFTRCNLVKGSPRQHIIKFLPASPKTASRGGPEQKIQVEGKKPVSYKDFLNGYPEAKKILPILQILPINK